MDYGREDYLKDLQDPNLCHIKDRERFEAFYDELGRDPIQHAQTFEPERLAFIEPVGDILELGCHIGFNLVYYARMGFRAVGVDVSSVLLTEAQKLISKEPLDVQNRIGLIHSFIEDLVPDYRFDTILLLETLEHVIDPLPIIVKARELLAPDGRIYLSAPSIRIGTFSHVRGISVDGGIRLCHAAGLSIVKAYEESWRGIYPNTFIVARLPEGDAPAEAS